MNKLKFPARSGAVQSQGMRRESKAGGSQDKHVTNTLEAV